MKFNHIINHLSIMKKYIPKKYSKSSIIQGVLLPSHVKDLQDACRVLNIPYSSRFSVISKICIITRALNTCYCDKVNNNRYYPYFNFGRDFGFGGETYNKLDITFKNKDITKYASNKFHYLLALITN